MPDISRQRRHFQRVSNGEEDDEKGEGKYDDVSESSPSSLNSEKNAVFQAIAGKFIHQKRGQQNEAAPVHGSPPLQNSNRQVIAETTTSTAPDDIDASQGSSSTVSTEMRTKTDNLSYELIRAVTEEAKDLREAVRSRNLKEVNEALRKRRRIREELMAQNAANGMGLLMLAVTMDDVNMLEYVTCELKTRMGIASLAKHLRYKDDMGRPIMFLAAKSSLAMFRHTTKLVRKTIGKGGLSQQLRQICTRGMNVLMIACTVSGVFEVVKDLAKDSDCLETLLKGKDGRGRNWILHAAEAGNLDVLGYLEKQQDKISELFTAVDNNGWTSFMYAARGKNVDFLIRLRELCVDQSFLRDQLQQEADDKSTILMHAAIGGFESYTKVYAMIQETGCMNQSFNDKSSVLLSWASKGGDVRVLNAVANGIKSGSFSNGVQGDNDWFMVSHNDEAARLSRAIMVCAESPETSLFLCAVESDSLDMIDAVLKGMNVLFQDAKDRWKMLCGHKGNPLTVAATRSVECFQKTLEGLKGVALSGANEVKTNLLGLLMPETTEKPETTELSEKPKTPEPPETNRSPLCNAVLSENPLVFDKILRTVKPLKPQHLKAKEILDQVKYAMRDIEKEKRFSEEWISARMLAKVLQAMKKAEEFNLALLNKFVQRAVSIRAFDHIRELIRIGCNLTAHFRSLIFDLAKNERIIPECIILAITTSSNPFRECGIASQWIIKAQKHGLKHAALDRLHFNIWDLMLKLLENLPRSVMDVGEELAREDSELDSFDGHIVGKINRSELLGFVVVGGMLEGSIEYSDFDLSRPLCGESPLAQAIRLGPRALDLLSQPLVMDYLRLKFGRTRPRWDDQKPCERSINQALYSYTHKTKASSGQSDSNEVFQRLLLLLQGWEIKGKKHPTGSVPTSDLSSTLQGRKNKWWKEPPTGTLPHRTALPGLQFTLAGIMGKPSSYYVVPAIRIQFVVFNYVATIGVYISCMSIESAHVPSQEWVFYVIMLSMAWRETLEFSNVVKLEQSLEASMERYFYDKWNFLDVITLYLVLVAFIFRMIGLATERQSDLVVAQFFLAATAPLLLSRLLFLSQAGSTIGPMTQVIFTMLKELIQFSVVLLLVMFGFALSFNALYGADTVMVDRNFDDCDANDHPIVEAFGETHGALLAMFQSMLGEFDFDLFYARYGTIDGEDCGGVIYPEFGVILLVAYLIITAVMLLNLLIAVLITAHSKVQQNASKEYQLARAKLILQSEEDVLRDVLPPPFNLVKPVLGIFWPVSQNGDQWYDSWWEITIGAIHRILFWLVMGLGALVITIVLWMTAIPLRAWKIYRRQKFKLTSETGESPNPMGAKSSLPEDPEHRRPSTDREIADTITKYTYMMDTSTDRLSPRLACAQLREGLKMLVPILTATGLCLVVYPLLSIALWLRGFGDVLSYIKEMRKKSQPWERRQLELGKGEEWSIARVHAIRKNKDYATANSSIGVFHVNTLLKTTTGKTMDDLWQDIVRQTGLEDVGHSCSSGAI